jgi:hypothetical protein
MPASVSIYVYVLDLEGGAPPVMDGIIPEHGPDIDLCDIGVPRVIRRAWFVCLITEVFLRYWSNW